MRNDIGCHDLSYHEFSLNSNFWQVIFLSPTQTLDDSGLSMVYPWIGTTESYGNEKSGSTTTLILLKCWSHLVVPETCTV